MQVYHTLIQQYATSSLQLSSSNSYCVLLEAEQSTPPLSKWINKQRRQEQTDRDTDRYLNNREADIKGDAVDSSASAHVGGTDGSSPVDGAVPNNLVG